MGGKLSSLDPMDVDVPELKNLLERDSYLRPYEREFRRRYACFKDYADKVGEHDGGLDNFTQAYKYYGIHINLDNSVTCREWAPGAHQLYLMGDFIVVVITIIITIIIITVIIITIIIIIIIIIITIIIKNNCFQPVVESI
uniref:Uncharacterized protein n=1 Tax=Timema bartmani TaxID=61472 RepID=A0A7R9EPG7_9NEOP|nr:unnamed protein product [Timema bartmani]